MREGRGQERAITGNRQTSWEFADAYGDELAGDAEGAALHWARERARQAGLRSVSPGTGAALRMLTATVEAKAVAEIGTGTGVSGIHLLAGMRPDGVLTTVDTEPERQQFAREAFRAAGFLHNGGNGGGTGSGTGAAGGGSGAGNVSSMGNIGNRVRFIPGRALDVLPRLADGGYDLVFCDGDRAECLAYLDEALRLLRPGGLVCFAGVFAETAGATAQPSEVLRLRELLRTVRESTVLLPSLLPVGDGLLCAVKRG
ncbi:O-methyltransferase [Streptomyces sp. NRRL F-5053]|uniref:O-methyltransferase n=1 Tax=Streptomyces sp. NRRL F-5053 TaxID=1463854 RepID=UPI0004CB940C|nr:O-methyltransferase [Streptomyces sp. NRRL F-5053]